MVIPGGVSSGLGAVWQHGVEARPGSRLRDSGSRTDAVCRVVAPPFKNDGSLLYFITHLHQLGGGGVKYVMIGLGVLLALLGSRRALNRGRDGRRQLSEAAQLPDSDSGQPFNRPRNFFSHRDVGFNGQAICQSGVRDLFHQFVPATRCKLRGRALRRHSSLGAGQELPRTPSDSPARSPRSARFRGGATSRAAYGGSGGESSPSSRSKRAIRSIGFASAAG